MKIYHEITSLSDFDAWSGGIDTKNIIVEKGLAEDFMAALEDYYPNGMTETELNDLLWFEPEEAFRLVGLDEDEDEDESEE